MAVEATHLEGSTTRGECQVEDAMAQFIVEEQQYPDNATRKNFVFLAYPFTPPISQDDYNTVVMELQDTYPLRLWYFLDEITTQELLRKIWRAILRADLCIFDITKGNANVAFELGLAVAVGKPCLTLLKTGEPNPLGLADLGYSERAEYASRETLKDKLRQLLVAKSSALRLFNKISYTIQRDYYDVAREQDEQKLIEISKHVFLHKKITKSQARTVVGDDRRATAALNALREANALRVEGAKKGATWVFTDSWVHHDHEVVGA
jgi:nucleoside 2-deoxyribosyltransferase